MDLQIKGKLALVTGSTAGIGHAIARELAAQGARVIVNGRDADAVRRTVEELKSIGHVHGAPGDVATAEGANAIVAEAARHGTVEILVNNAGIFEMQPFEEIEDETWERFFRTNVLSGIRLSRLFLPGMKTSNWGRIIFISSESAINIPNEMIHYGMTKTAQLAVSRGLAKSLRGTGITVNSVLPGPTWTRGVEEMTRQIAEKTHVSVEEARKNFVPSIRPSSITQRIADPSEVAHMVAFLCSPLASSTTGSAVRVDGGIVETCF